MGIQWTVSVIKTVGCSQTCGDTLPKIGRSLANSFFEKKGLFSPEIWANVAIWQISTQRKKKTDGGG
jgi:hypothetical protein